MNIPVEAIEMDYPMRIRRYELAPDTGGGGKFRGGLGIVREYEMLAESSRINVRGDRAEFAPKACTAGRTATRATTCCSMRRRREDREIPSKFSGQIRRGDRLRVTTPGGGGYGPPSERAAGAHAHDVRNAKVVGQNDSKAGSDGGIDVPRDPVAAE